MVKILGVVASLLVVGVIVLLGLGKTVPTELWSSLTLVVGGVVGNLVPPQGVPPAPPK